MKKWDRIVMLIIIVVLIGIIGVLLFNKQESNTQSNIFEKKKMCVDMRNSYEEYLLNKYVADLDNRSMGEVELFYNSERDTCLGAFRYRGSSNNETFEQFLIEDFMNGDEEIFKCGGYDGLKNLECEEQWKEKKIELGK